MKTKQNKKTKVERTEFSGVLSKKRKKRKKRKEKKKKKRKKSSSNFIIFQTAQKNYDGNPLVLAQDSIPGVSIFIFIIFLRLCIQPIVVCGERMSHSISFKSDFSILSCCGNNNDPTLIDSTNP